MIETYTTITVCGLAAILMPSAALAYMRRPKPFRYVLRGGEASVCLAFAVDAARRLALIAGGTPLVYPGDEWALINLTLITVSALLLWGRIAQIVRHDIRNREASKVMLKHAEDLGIDVSHLKKK